MPRDWRWWYLTRICLRGRWRRRLLRSPEGTLISQRHYYPFSSVYFYANRTGLLLNGRIQNLEYGSNAPGAPDVFIDDPQFVSLWDTSARYYLLAVQSTLPHLQSLGRRCKIERGEEQRGQSSADQSAAARDYAPQDIGDAADRDARWRIMSISNLTWQVRR